MIVYTRMASPVLQQQRWSNVSRSSRTVRQLQPHLLPETYGMLELYGLLETCAQHSQRHNQSKAHTDMPTSTSQQTLQQRTLDLTRSLQSLSMSALIFSRRLAGMRRLKSSGLAFFTASKSIPNSLTPSRSAVSSSSVQNDEFIVFA